MKLRPKTADKITIPDVFSSRKRKRKYTSILDLIDDDIEVDKDNSSNYHDDDDRGSLLFYEDDDEDVVAEVESSDDDIVSSFDIKVMIATSKIITVKVKALDTVGSVKVKIQEQKHIPFDMQELIFNGKALEDMDILGNLRIKKESILTLMRKSSGIIKILIKTPEGRILDSLRVKRSDTIGEVKEMISCSSGYALVFNDIVLENSGTLADFNIVNGSTLTRIVKSLGSMKIYVRTYTGKTLSLLVDPTYTIADVKLLIEQKEEIPHDEQVLMYGTMVYEDSSTLYNLYINKKTTLTLMHKPKGFSKFMKIFIKTLIKGTVTLEVKPLDTIGDLKVKIQDKVDVRVDEQVLIFNEMVLSDETTLADYHINDESTLNLFQITKGVMSIFIKPLGREDFTLEVKPSDTIHDVKTKIHEKEGISLSKQRLFVNEKLLQDTPTLADYYIQKNSTLQLVIR